jgi:hypothetical protein
MTPTEASIVVGRGEIKVSDEPSTVLTCLGLGSCIGLASQLQRSFGISAQHSFACSSCGTHGHVAAKVRCTSCGNDALWGWWPKDGAVNDQHQHSGSHR